MTPFSRQEALNWWAHLVHGWATHLDPTGARTWMNGIRNFNERDGSSEGLTRMLWGIGGWLSQPEREPRIQWQDKSYNVATLARDGILAGCDPESPGYWNVGGRNPDRYFDQRIVEAAPVAYFLWQTQNRIWQHLDVAERASILEHLIEFGQRPPYWANNWSLFWLLNHAFRKVVGEEHDQSLIDSVVNDYLDKVYVGNGWYDDTGGLGLYHFDDYNYLVFVTHVLAWAEMDGHTQPARRDELFARIELCMMDFPYFFATDGAYPAFGRSQTYKFARVSAAIWAYRHGLWPHSVGMLRRLVGRHMRWHMDRGAVRGDGTVRQEYTVSGSLSVREPYMSTGSPYWTMLVFNALWALPDNDQFWETEEVALPAEEGDLIKVYDPPGWVISATDGQVIRFNARSQGHAPSYAHKYGKFAYGSLFPFNVGLETGQFSVDNMLCLQNDRVRSHRHLNYHAAVGEPGWLRMVYPQILGDHEHMIDTTILVMGALQLRAHRIKLTDDAAISAVEGGATLGFEAGGVPHLQQGNGWLAATIAYPEPRTTLITQVRGYDAVRYWSHPIGSNLVYAHSITPVLDVEQVQRPVHDLICIVYMGKMLEDPKAVIVQPDYAQWTNDDTFECEWNGQRWQIPPPA